MLYEAQIDGVDIILNGHILAEDYQNTVSVGRRYVTRAELNEAYPKNISERFFDENRSEMFKDWDDLDIDAKMVVFNLMTLECGALEDFYECRDYDHWRVEKALPYMMKELSQ